MVSFSRAFLSDEICGQVQTLVRLSECERSQLKTALFPAARGRYESPRGHSWCEPGVRGAGGVHHSVGLFTVGGFTAAGQWGDVLFSVQIGVFFGTNAYR